MAGFPANHTDSADFREKFQEKRNKICVIRAICGKPRLFVFWKVPALPYFCFRKPIYPPIKFNVP